MRHMVEDLLDIARAEKGRIVVNLKPVELPAILAAAVETCRPAIDERGHDLQLLPDVDIIVPGDAARLQQVG